MALHFGESVNEQAHPRFFEKSSMALGPFFLRKTWLLLDKYQISDKNIIHNIPLCAKLYRHVTQKF